MIHDVRTYAREGRLLVVLAAGTRSPNVSDLDGLVGVDFLLQHPSLLERFAAFAKQPWEPGVRASSIEADSSEEALLGWKRSVAGDVVVPLLRRLLGRGLVRSDRTTLELTVAGTEAASRVASAMASSQQRRVELVAGAFRSDPVLARDRLAAALPRGGT